MSALADHADDYLRLRRALGFKLTQPGQMLPQFIAWLDAADITTVTVEATLAWVRLSKGKQPVTYSHQLGAVRGFARYLQTIDPATEIPPAGIFGKQQRRAPYVYSEEEITRLLHAARQLRPPLRATTYETLFGLLAATGLRIGEALRLTREEVDLADGLIRIRHTKFDRDRLVPLHRSVTDTLGDYAARRDRLCPPDRAATFFVSSRGTALRYNAVNAAFHTLLASAGLPTTTGPRPRIHGLRHSFAVHTLIGWQREGIDVASQLPVLSTYLGHVSPASTYWYLSAVPELMQLAAARLDDHAARTSGADS